MIELMDTTQVRAFWFGSTGKIDLFACVLKQEGETWKALYRVRYYAGTDDPFDGTDHKNWYTVKPKEGTSPETLCEAMDMVATSFTETFGVAHDRLDVDGDGRKAIDMLADRDYVHLKYERIRSDA